MAEPKANLRVDPALVEGGRRAFAQYGYASATLERIAQEAGISRVTLHRRGVSKAQILAALVEQATAEYQRAMWPALTGDGSARERLTLALSALCDSAERDLEVLVALRASSDAVFHDDAGRGDPDAMTRNVFTEPLDRLLRDGVADGSLRAVDTLEMATVLFNLVGGTYVHLRTGHRWPPQRARAAVLDIAVRGLVPM